MERRQGTRRREDRVLARYLERHAEREATALPLPRRYERALVVPVCRERPDFLDGLLPALAGSPGPNLGIIVLNEPAGSDAQTHAQNQELLAALLGTRARALRTAPDIWLSSGSGFDLMVVSRLSPDWALPRRQGVGLARKLGVDLASLAHVEGQLASPWVVVTDADVRLAWETLAHVPDERATAVCLPFVHEPGDDPAVHEATLLVELELHYTVLGANAAGSPYAFHTLGSALAVHIESHAAARGFPRRAAGEDFHLLRKLAKLGPIEVPAVPPVRIRSRRSDRVPFGTGPSVERLLQGEAPCLDDPAVFDELGRWFGRLRANGPFSRAAFESAFPGPSRGVVSELWNELGFDAFAARLALLPLDQQRARLLEWFDSLRCQQLIHRLRATCSPKLPWRRALERARFVPAAEISGNPSPDQALEVLRRLEASLPRLRGPTLFGFDGQREPR